MTVTPNNFIFRFEEFCEVRKGDIQLAIDEAELLINESVWCDRYDLGVYYLTAHIIALNERSKSGDDEASSIVSGKAVDGTSISFAVPSINDLTDAYLASTVYGQRFAALKSDLGVAAYVI